MNFWKEENSLCVHSLLESSFDRKMFNLYPLKHNKVVPLTATIAQEPSVNYAKNLALYQPKSQFQIEDLSETKFRHLKGDEGQFRKVSTTKMGVKERVELMKEKGWKMSEKSMELAN